MQTESLGAFLIRGDNIAVIGEVDVLMPKQVFGEAITPMHLH